MSLARPLLGIALSLAAAAASAAPPAFTATEMMRLRRLSDPQPSPDGRRLVYALQEVDLAGGTRNTDLWLSPVAGGEPSRLAASPASESHPRWSRDGRRLGFLSTRGGSAQVWAVEPGGGEPQQLTSLATGVESFEWLDEARLLVVARVHPDCGADDACNKLRLEAEGKRGSARAYDELLYRHWDTWGDGRRSHLLVVPLDGGKPVDLTPGPDDVPPFSLGNQDLDVAPDGSEVCFSRKDSRDEAWSTNAELFVVKTSGGEPKRISTFAGYDGGCRYSPDGRLLAWRAQERAGYESDRWQLLVLERASGETRRLTPDFDRQADEPAFSADSKSIYFTADEAGRVAVFRVSVKGGPVTRLALPETGSFGDLRPLADGSLVASLVSLTHPAEVVRFAADGSGIARLTRVNDAVLAPFALRPGESVSWTGAEGKSVQGWLVKPADFDPAKRYPLLVAIHGGPQGAWNDSWTYRWNAQVFAGRGYVVLLPNPRGSTGWGQAFTDDINRDWGGRAFEDVMKGTDWAEALPFVAKGRSAAAGGSYGGYLVNWIAGHTDRYRALVSHSGLFDLVSMYGATEELWFPEWELGGPPWKSPELYERWSPRAHATSFRTPTLVVHGERDYRVPVEQGLQMFTALRRQGVPARLLTFPDENHWILKPANSVRWYEEVLGWLDRWTKPQAGSPAAR